MPWFADGSASCIPPPPSRGRPRRARSGPPNAGTGPRAGLDLILDQRSADMADLPSGASGLLVRGYKARRPIGW
jgi:hypothetical protein